MSRRRATAAVSGVIVLLGVVLVIETLASGGGSTGYVVGALFVLAGAGRLYLSTR
jgi:hypothetical protein